MTVNNLAELQSMAPGVPRIHAANEYIEAREAAIRDARLIRNHDIRLLIAEHGPAKAARMAGVSLTTIKTIRGA